MKTTRTYLVMGFLLVIGIMLLIYLVRFGSYVYTTMQVINTRAAKQADYTRITTPLPAGVAHDVCVKFAISPNDRRCQSGAVVYGPDFFPDVKSYFRSLPKKDATYQSVQDKLGAYWVSCETPVDNQGDYRCEYDLRGDGIYRIAVYFTKEGFLSEIIASTGGS